MDRPWRGVYVLKCTTDGKIFATAMITIFKYLGLSCTALPTGNRLHVKKKCEEYQIGQKQSFVSNINILFIYYT